MPIYAYTTKAGETRYRVVYRDPDHHQRSKRGFKRKIDARNYEASVTVDKATGQFIPPERARITINGLAPGWLAGKKHLKVSSYRPLERAWKTHVQPRWGDVELRNLEHSDIQQWVSELAENRSATTVIRAFGVLHGIVTTAIADRRLTVDPCDGIGLPRKHRKPHVYLTMKQVDTLASKSGEHRLLILTLAFVGTRWGETIALRPMDLDLDKRRIAITRNATEVDGEFHVGPTKNYENRSVPVPAFLADELRETINNLDDDDLIFPDYAGTFQRRPGTGAKKRSWWKNALKAAGLPLMTVHDLRRTAASLAISAGANVKALQRMLGHSSAAVTLDVYSDLFDTDLDKVADAVNDAWITRNVATSVATSTDSTHDEGPTPQ